MKLSLTDKLHVSVALNIFLIVWFGLEWIDQNINGIWFGLLAVVILAFFKELNDKFGWFKFLLTDGKNTTGFTGKDFWMGTGLPLIITIIYYILYK